MVSSIAHAIAASQQGIFFNEGIERKEILGWIFAEWGRGIFAINRISKQIPVRFC
jgi:hypothetical protein